MISLLHACCSTILSGSARFVPKSSSRGYFSPWNSCIQYPGIRREVDLPLYLTKVHVQCYSTKKSSGVRSRKSKLVAKLEPGPVNESPTKDEKDAFFVIRKGDVIGVYKSLSDCQAQVGTSICDPPASIYKGYSMPKDTEKYLLSCGLQNALYSIRAADITGDLFGTLLSCPFQPSLRDETSREPITEKEQETMPSEGYGQSCTLEFDGASKGNPGRAGAGAILRSEDGSLICRLSEGLGVATNNVAEYRAVILGLRVALEKGFTSVRARGDSKLVCMQIQGLWKVGSKNIFEVYEEAKKLKDMFVSFEISHVRRDLNSDADAQANLAVDLAEGQVTESIA